MKRLSAGLLIYRFKNGNLEVFLVHPGGPYWAKKDTGAWSIPKGEYSEGEDPFTVAKREFHEETGFEAGGKFIQLPTLRQPSGKIITAWAAEGDFPTDKIKSNTFTIEWPPKSGKQTAFPEVDHADWFSIDVAMQKIIKGQTGFIRELCRILKHETFNDDVKNNEYSKG